MNPCKDWCFARFGKEYTKECDKHCDYARLHVELKQLRADLERVKADRNAAIEQLHGYCPACKNYTPNHNEGECEECKHEYFQYQNIDARDKWESCGIKKGDHDA